MAASIDHVLLTRFNLPTGGHEGVIRAREGWLRHRVTLFERYCLPSVLAQTSRRFRWLIYFDPQSPEWLKDRVRDHAGAHVYVPIFRPAVSRDDLVRDITAATGRAGARLITTNLDNDDGLAADFVQRLQAADPGSGRLAVYLSYGLIKTASHVYLRRDARNAFCSVGESWESPVTCWADWHTLLGKTMPVRQLDGAPGWLQVVHGANVSNRVRGRLVSPSGYVALFPGLLDDVPVPGPAQRAGDLLTAMPVRVARETGRGLAKRAALGLLGKEGLGRAKALLAQAGWRAHGTPGS